jgi:histidinol-phosphate aminotransferase
MNSDVHWQAAVRNIAPDVHGAIDYAELESYGIQPYEIIDFSANVNPYGPSPAVGEAVIQAPIHRYPDREALALRRELASRLSLSMDRIVVGNGAAELLWLTAFSFIQAGDPVLIIGPTFGEYARCARLMGAQVEILRAEADADFQVSLHAVERMLAKMHPCLIFICNPNNPTGSVIAPDQIGWWARSYLQTLFVVDEVYRPFAEGIASVLDLGLPNILSVNSMTKDHAIPGLRLGYIAGSVELIRAIARVRPPWNVNAAAQAAGIAALSDGTHALSSLKTLRQDKQLLLSGLQTMDLYPVSSATHYSIVDVKDGAAFRHHLLQKRILVRDCASFGLANYVRISTQRPEHNQALLAAIGEMTL